MNGQDPWGPRYKKRVKAYFAMFIGTICVILGGALLLFRRAAGPDPTSLYDVILGGGIILLGLCAALPQLFMPIAAMLIHKLPGEPLRDEVIKILTDGLKDHD